MANTIGWGSGAANNSIGWGQGKTNNAIGWGNVYSSSPSGETDLVGVIPPISLTSPVISGSGVVGQTLSTTDGTWSGTLPITYTYQWNRNGSEILGATFNTYTLVTADASTSIDCTVTATNAGGSLSKNSNAISVAAAGDADANAFITAAAITDTTQKAAIDTLVTDLKNYGIWTKMKAIYPFIGGTAAQHKFNLKNPLDTNAAFRLVFNGGWTHSSTGAKPNGTNAWANSFFNPSLHNVANSSHMSYYSRTLFADTITNACEMGCFTASGAQRNLIFASGNGTSYCVPNNNNEFIVSFASNGVGFYLASRTSATAIMGQRNSTQYTNTATTARINNIISLGAGSGPAAGLYSSYSPRESAFASIGDGLSATEAANYYTAVQNFQVSLSRQV